MRIRDDHPDRRSSAALILAIAAILLVTLLPRFGPSEDIRVLCLLCGTEGAADSVLNVLLFFPAGFLACQSRRAPWVAAIGILLLTIGIESLQLLIPGRYPTVGDVAANTLGGFIGIGAATFAVRHPGKNRRLLPVGLLPSLLVSASLPATLYLLEPEIPPGVYYGQWMAEFGQLATYDGVLHDARVGSLPLPDRRLDESAVDGIRNISARSPLHIDFTAAPAPPSLAPILSVFDRRQAVLLLVGVEADAVVVHLRRRARTYRFRAPALRYREFHPAVGSRVTLDVRRQDGAICLDHDGTSSCRPLAAPGRSWSLLLGSAPATLPEGLLDGVWLALLGLFAVAACSILPSSIGRGVQALVLGLPAVTYVTLWLLAGDGGWLPGLAGLVLGSAAWMHRLRRSTVGSC